ncbi:MAG: hypothetical protein V8R64_16310 [Thomasclavelia sp.]
MLLLPTSFYELDQGMITIGGIDIATIDPEVLLSKFSIVFKMSFYLIIRS